MVRSVMRTSLPKSISFEVGSVIASLPLDLLATRFHFDLLPVCVTGVLLLNFPIHSFNV
jgi:hypothetical protein